MRLHVKSVEFKLLHFADSWIEFCSKSDLSLLFWFNLDIVVFAAESNALRHVAALRRFNICPKQPGPANNCSLLGPDDVVSRVNTTFHAFNLLRFFVWVTGGNLNWSSGEGGVLGIWKPAVFVGILRATEPVVNPARSWHHCYHVPKNPHLQRVNPLRRLVELLRLDRQLRGSAPNERQRLRHVRA